MVGLLRGAARLASLSDVAADLGPDADAADAASPSWTDSLPLWPPEELGRGRG